MSKIILDLSNLMQVKIVALSPDEVFMDLVETAITHCLFGTWVCILEMECLLASEIFKVLCK